MADQKRWFKVWTTILHDPDFRTMPVEDVGRWVLLGALIAAHGDYGGVRIPRLRYLTELFKCQDEEGSPNDSESIEVLENFPHIIISERPIRWPHGRHKLPVSEGVSWRCGQVLTGRCGQVFEEWCRELTNFYVTFENWDKYQHDGSKEKGGSAGNGQDGGRIGEMTMRKIWNLYTAYQPKTPSEVAFFDESVKKINLFRELRRQRLMDSRVGIPPLLWFVLLAGGISTISFTFLFGTDNLKAQIVMGVLLSTMIALILFTIMSLDFPFTGNVSVSSEPFRIAILE